MTATPRFKNPQSILYIFLNHAFNWGLWPLIIHVFSPNPLPLYKPLLIPFFSFHSVSRFLKLLYPFSPSFAGSMVKTRGAHSFWSWVRRTSPLPAVSSSPGAPAVGGLSTASTATAATTLAPAAIQGSAATVVGVGSSSVAPAQRRYHTRVSPTPPDPSHPRPAQRAPQPKRAWTSGPGESSTSRPRALPSPPYQGIARAPNLSPASIIRQPYFHCSPIPRNADCSARDLHGEVYYDLPAFSEDSELRDSMLLV